MGEAAQDERSHHDGPPSGGDRVDIQLTGHGVEQFSTPRLVGRRLLPADTDFLVGLHEQQAIMALHGGARSRASTEPFVRSNVAHWRHFQFGLYVISLVEEPDVAIGRAGLRWDPQAAPSTIVDLSVVLDEPMWGQGLGTEAVKALAGIGLDLELPLTATSEARHAAARRVLEKVGFTYETEIERHERSWVRYHWPADRESPATVAKQVAGRSA